MAPYSRGDGSPPWSRNGGADPTLDGYAEERTLVIPQSQTSTLETTSATIVRLQEEIKIEDGRD